MLFFRRDDRAPPTIPPDAESRATWLSRITFHWVAPLIARGHRIPLQLPDLPPLLEADQSRLLRHTFSNAYRAVATADLARHTARTDLSTNGTLSGVVDDALADFQLNPAATDALSESTHTPAKVTRLTRLAARIPPRLASKTSRALLPGVLRPFVTAGLFKPFWLLASVVQVLSIRALVARLAAQTSNNPPTTSRWVYLPVALAMTLSTLMMSICQHSVFSNSMRAGMRARAAISANVYRKMLRLSPASLANITDGELGNFLVTDPQRIVDSFSYAHFCLFSFFELSVVFGLLAIDLGLSALFGAAVLVLLVPSQLAFSTYVARARAKVSAASDVRVQKMNEILSGIRMVKLSAWEPHFKRMVEELRSAEVGHLRVAATIRAVNAALFIATPILITLIMFTTHTLLFGRHLSPSVAFSALGYVSIVTRVLTLAPLGWLGMSEAYVASRRLDRFFDLPELSSIPRDERLDVSEVAADDAARALDISSYQTPIESPRNYTKDKFGLTLSHASFSFAARTIEQTEEMSTVLHDITISANPGDLVCIVGPVGSGKSSLLQGMLGEIRCTRGYVSKYGQVAYCSQQPWIINGTLRENITLFGQGETPWDPAWYELVIERCCLGPDIAVLPASDLTEIGERGVNLSGGQKARVALARAVYAKAEIYLLDDPLSAIDSAVTAKILQGLIGPDGILANRVQIIVTHNIHVLPFASHVVVLGGGTVAHAGTFDELRERGIEFSGVLADDIDEDIGNVSENDCEQSDTEDVEHQHEEDHLKEILRDSNVDISPFNEDLKDKKKNDPSSGKTIDEFEENGLGMEDPDIFGKLPGSSTDEPFDQLDNLVVEEDRKTGQVAGRIYQTYIKAGGGYLSLTGVSIIFILSQLIRQLAEFWVAKWTTSIPESLVSNEDKLFSENRHYVLVFLGLSIGTLLFTLLRAAVFTDRTMKASRCLHDKLLERVLHARPSFFDTNPIGRILNRFSKDMDLMDINLPMTSQDVLQIFFIALSAVISISIVIPWFIVSLLPSVILFIFLQKRYKSSSRELKRLDGLAFSPIYSQFVESSVGLATIRAHKWEKEFSSTFEGRVDEHHQAYHMFHSAGRWVGIRLDVVSALVTLATAVVVLAMGDTLDSGLAGVALTQSIIMTGSFQWGIRQAAETENLFTSVERIASMATETKIEAPFEIEEKKPPQSWPSDGVISFEKVVLKYRPELDPALHSLSFSTNSRERIGIVGRTGSGKSSLFVSLFRLVELTEGQITIDGVDISEMGLHDLRSRMAIVPQDPVLFNGTIRSNLDPIGKFSDVELWDALHRVHMSEAINSISGTNEKEGHGLDLMVNEKGSNFSAGERQLLSLARAILSGVRVVVLDEASASLDNHTDMLVQKTVREQLSDRTVLTIAHRLATIADSDRILVMDAGEVVEFDTPAMLLSKGGYFKRLIEETGPVESAILKAIIAQASVAIATTIGSDSPTDNEE